MLLYLHLSAWEHDWKSVFRNLPPTLFPLADTWRGESLGSLACRRLALQAFVMKSQALDVLFRLGMGLSDARRPSIPRRSPCLGLCRFGSKC